MGNIGTYSSSSTAKAVLFLFGTDSEAVFGHGTPWARDRPVTKSIHMGQHSVNNGHLFTSRTGFEPENPVPQRCSARRIVSPGTGAPIFWSSLFARLLLFIPALLSPEQNGCLAHRCNSCQKTC